MSCYFTENFDGILLSASYDYFHCRYLFKAYKDGGTFESIFFSNHEIEEYQFLKLYNNFKKNAILIFKINSIYVEKEI
jgi:hypothetical protein